MNFFEQVMNTQLSSNPGSFIMFMTLKHKLT